MCSTWRNATRSICGALSLSSGWRLPFAGPLGDRYQFSASVRGDGYDTDFSPGYGISTTRETKVTGRVFPQVGLNWRYPWVDQLGNISALVEPIVAAFAAPVGGNPAGIPNEDAQSFEFDDTDLFVGNRFPGYDRVDGGQRVDYGLHAGVFNPIAGSTQILVGESYRFQSNSAVSRWAPASIDRRSDVVGRVDRRAQPVFQPVLSRPPRQPGSGDAAPGSRRLRRRRKSATARSAISRPRRSRASRRSCRRARSALGLNFALTDKWSGQVTQTQNLNQGATSLNSALRLTYRDDCLAVTGSIQRSAISVGDVRPGVSFVLTFVFRDLGDVVAIALKPDACGADPQAAPRCRLGLGRFRSINLPPPIMKFALPMKWLLALGFVLALAGACQAQETRIAAVVNNDIITADDVDARLDALDALLGHPRYAAEPPAAPAPGAAAAHRREARDAGGQALQGRRRRDRDRQGAHQHRDAQQHAEGRARPVSESGGHSALHPGRSGHRLADLEQGGRRPLLLGCQRLRYRGQ